MGSYIYRTSPGRFMTLPGIGRVHLATYAYKPYIFGAGLEGPERRNARLAFRTGVVASEAAWKRRGPDERPAYIMMADDDGSFGSYIAQPRVEDRWVTVRTFPEPLPRAAFYDDDFYDRSTIAGYYFPANGAFVLPDLANPAHLGEEVMA